MKTLNFSKAEETVPYLKSKEEGQNGIVLFSSVKNILDLSTKSTDNVILCSTSGEYTSNGYKDGAVTGFEYDLKEADIVEILDPPVKSIGELKKAYSKVKNNKNSFMLLLCDGLGSKEETIMSTLFFMDSNFKIIGGSAGDNLQFKETFIFIGSKRVKNVAIFMNSKRRTSLIKENIYTKTGKMLLVTKSDVLNRTVKTFNNEPASLEYAKIMGVDEGDLQKHFINHPLGKIYENDLFIASPMKVNEDKSITFYSELMSNTYVHLLKPENPIDVLYKTLGGAEFKPSFVLTINCILRSLKFIQDNVWKDFDREMLKFCNNTTGFISYGEQYYRNHANQTMVMLLVE